MPIRLVDFNNGFEEMGHGDSLPAPLKEKELKPENTVQQNGPYLRDREH